MSRKISAIAVLAILSGGGSAIAQIVPDETLGNERSGVIPLDSPLFPVNRRAPVDFIVGGANRGTNLFHSFLRFNVAEGRSVFFNSFANTQNILARVTGREPSQILGTLGIFRLPGATTNPNLFLINPNGIIFGANAELSVPGSFLATTANAVQLGNSGLFSATEPEKSNLLTVEPSAFLFSTIAAQASIQVNQSVLSVPDRQNLVFLGGNVTFQQARTIATNGQVEIGGLVEPGTVGFHSGNFRLQFPQNASKSNVLMDGSVVRVTGSTGGSITIYAQNLSLNSSDILAGISSNANGGTLLATLNDEGSTGAISLFVRDSINLTEGSQILTQVGDAEGRTAGDIRIETGSISLTDGAQISSSALQRGQAGDITIDARDSVIIRGQRKVIQDEEHIFIQSRVSSTLGTLSLTGAVLGDAVVGQAGNIRIQARSITVQDEGRLSTNTFGRGNSGNITLRANEQVLLGGGAALLNDVSSGATGNGGTIDIQADSLILNDAQILSLVRGPEEDPLFGVLPGGRGQAGNIRITVNDDMTVVGSLPSFPEERPLTQAIIGSSVTPEGVGQSGYIAINVGGKLTLTNSFISSDLDKNANGQANSINITADSILLSNGAQISTSTQGQGSAGDIIIHAQNEISLDGRPTSIFSNVGFNGIGEGGDIRVSANSLMLTNSAQLNASTQGAGGAGNIFLGRDDKPISSVLISGTDTLGRSTALFTSTSSDRRSGGNIRIFADRFQLSDSAVVDARTFASGNSGTISLNANLVEILRGGQFLALTQSSGSSGQITIAANQLRISGTDPTFEQRRTNFPTRVAPISPESGIYTRSIGSGSAGSIFVTGSQIQLDDRARIDAQSSTVDGGNISIRASDRLVLRNNSQISATAGTAQAPGNGGNISITAPRIELNDRARIDAQSATADGGDIFINAIDRLVLRNNSQISTTAGTAQAPGDGGNIDITARFLIAIPKENSDIAANAFQGSGGNVTIATQGGILGFESRSRSTPLSDITASSEIGISGTVTLNTPDTNNLQNSLTQLPQSAIDTNALLANSCIVRNPQNGTFFITGTGGLPTNPGELSTYSTGTVQPTTAWKPGDAIVEPQGVYQLPNGSLILSRECN